MLNLNVQFFQDVTRVAAQVVRDVSEESSAFIFRIKQSKKSGLTASQGVLCTVYLIPKTRRHHSGGLVCWAASLLKVKIKFTPRTGDEGPEGEQMYSSTLPSTSALDAGG